MNSEAKVSSLHLNPKSVDKKLDNYFQVIRMENKKKNRLTF